MRDNVVTMRRFLISLTLSLVAAACADETRVTSPEPVTEEEPSEPAGYRSFVASVTCTADVTAGEISCGPVPVVDGGTESGPQRVILGGQNQYVTLTSTNVSYDGGTEIFQADVTVTNLVAQGLGSPDRGVTTTGVRVFHHSGPTTTGGTGTVTVSNADGTGTFTGASQPYHSYDVYLPENATSPSKTWEWSVPPTVSTFEFEVFVDADVWGENGYVDVTPGSAYFTTVSGSPIALSATVRDVVDRPIGGTVTWTSSNPSIADVDPNTGVVTAFAAGVVDIVASTGGPEADGFSRITVDPFVAGFQIELHFLTPMTASQAAAFNNAVARWEALITGDLSAILIAWEGNECGMPIDEYVDDLAINVRLDSIDGPSKILASAGPCFVRTTGGLPAYGVMQFDTADVAQMETDGQFGDVVLHEMGHVLGFGVLWNNMGLLSDDNGILTDCFPVEDDPPPPLTTDPFFSGTGAITAFNNNGGLSYVGNKVPVEDDYGPGTRCGHWREAILDDELMTGFVEAPMTAMPLSEVTVQSFADLGYTVASSGWDAWTCPFCAPPSPAEHVVNAQADGLRLLNDVWLGPVYAVDEAGQITLVRPDRRR